MGWFSDLFLVATGNMSKSEYLVRSYRRGQDSTQRRRDERPQQIAARPPSSKQPNAHSIAYEAGKKAGQTYAAAMPQLTLEEINEIVEYTAPISVS